MLEVLEPVPVIYCGVCTFPPEYCEFGGSFKLCKEWLKENEPGLFEQLYLEDALANATLLLLLEKEEKMNKDLAKKQAKEEAKAERALQKKLQLKVVIQQIARTKRKQVVAVSGLEVFGVDLKKLAKQFASKFATGASVTKNVEKKVDEIVIQGDVADEVKVFITKMLEDKGLLDVKVEVVAKKKEKKAEEGDAAAAAGAA